MSKKQKDKDLPIKIAFRDFWEIDEQQVSSSFQKLWEDIEQLPPQETFKPKRAFNRWKLATIAASIALLFVSGLYWYVLSHPAQPEIAYITNSATQITLSDGTKVWMNAQSQLRCQKTFTGKTRDVVLEGEAYFEVAHNKKQPFRVLAGGQIVEALGTSFNVRAFPEEQTVKVALVEGSVRVTDDKTVQAIVLEPAQEATIVKNAGSIWVTDRRTAQAAIDEPAQDDVTVQNTAPIAISDIDLDKVMSWKTGRYIFNNMTFGDIAKTLERGFGVSIQIEDEMLKNKPYTMRFENEESLETILDLIQINAKYTYQYKNGIIVIK